MFLPLIMRRLAFLVLVLLGLALITFFLSHVVPADPARLYAGPRASAAAVAQIRHQFGLDLPIPEQFFNYVKNLLGGDFGYSLTTHRAVSADLVDKIPATIELTLVAIFLVLLIGIPLGVLSAVKPGSVMDHVGRAVSITGVALPAFWLGLMAQLVLFDQLGWLPSGGRLDPALTPPTHITGLYTVDSLLTGNLPIFAQSIYNLILPAAVLGFGSLAVLTRQIRASMLEVLAQDYVRTAKAKGLVRLRVIVRHALRNALLPATTVMGLQIGNLLGGALLVEEVFAWPGIGRYATDATLTFDYNAVMGVTLIAAFIYVLVNLA
ncbi:MAG: dipeptide transport system permease protein dppB, partial [Chloroflexi bacterium]|nr:dipeptide transport system permease protein dppB [Chloroflexota bacterium]